MWIRDRGSQVDPQGAEAGEHGEHHGDRQDQEDHRDLNRPHSPLRAELPAQPHRETETMSTTTDQTTTTDEVTHPSTADAFRQAASLIRPYAPNMAYMLECD